MIMFFFKEIKSLLREIDEKKAQVKKERLTSALELLEKAKTKEEQQHAIKEVTRNSF
jgi:hypothetical protein